MSKSRIGKGANDIFSKSKQESPSVKHTVSQEPASKEKQGRGRPLEHKEGWSKVTVVLLDKQIHWLDQLGSTIRLNTKSAVSRAEIIRALVSAMDESGIDFTQSESEEELKALILKSLRDK